MRFRRRRRSKKLDATAENIGRALGRVAARLDAWKRQRAVLVAEIQELAASAQQLLEDASDATGKRAAAVVKAASPKGGRPKGYKMSAATKRKLRDAWKRRKAAIAAKLPTAKG